MEYELGIMLRQILSNQAAIGEKIDLLQARKEKKMEQKQKVKQKPVVVETEKTEEKEEVEEIPTVAAQRAKRQPEAVTEDDNDFFTD